MNRRQNEPIFISRTLLELCDLELGQVLSKIDSNGVHIARILSQAVKTYTPTNAEVPPPPPVLNSVAYNSSCEMTFNDFLVSNENVGKQNGLINSFLTNKSIT